MLKDEIRTTQPPFISTSADLEFAVIEFPFLLNVSNEKVLDRKGILRIRKSKAQNNRDKKHMSLKQDTTSNIKNMVMVLMMMRILSPRCL